MIYTFKCESCFRRQEVSASIKIGPPNGVVCTHCKLPMARDWQSDIPEIDTTLCRDHSDVPVQHQVVGQTFDGMKTHYVKTAEAARRKERAYAAEMDDFRRRKRAGGPGSMEMVRRVPAELHHGKIKETGDRHYWDDPKNLRKHRDCEV